MLALPASVRVFFATAPCDMRRGFDALGAMVRENFGDDPLSGHLYVFRSRRGDRLKILWWDRDGYVLWQKRLEKGTFRVAATPAPSAARIELDRRPLAMLLEGIDPAVVKKTRRFSLNPLVLMWCQCGEAGQALLESAAPLPSSPRPAREHRVCSSALQSMPETQPVAV